MTEIRTLRAPNPSALTGTGTNTYLLGRGDVAVIDPGPASEAHLAAILDSLAAGERITHILVTHPHLDHSALAPRLSAATGAPVLAFGGATAGRSPLMSSLAAAGMAGGGEGLDHSFAPDRHLADGETVAGASWSVTALHTPGHLGAHLCFAAEDVLFSGDHVMGWSTSIVSPPDGDMTDYMNSLRRLASQAWLRLLPGHGEPVETPAERLRALIDHRLQREAQILDALTLGPADATTLTQRVYTDIAPALLPAARRNVLAHLIDLTSKGSVSTPDLLRHDTAFHLS
ncbi:MBL fold metallo-hydrolase [Paragemmobacter straminiformis]|nr:MBL fold metallo-hydrolase [Gemmobacter straminiformis]